MDSRTTARFWRAFEQLPEPIQEAARKAYQLWQQDPYHPSLRFKQVHPTKPIYSVRISRDWRAVGVIATAKAVKSLCEAQLPLHPSDS